MWPFPCQTCQRLRTSIAAAACFVKPACTALRRRAPRTGGAPLGGRLVNLSRSRATGGLAARDGGATNNCLPNLDKILTRLHAHLYMGLTRSAVSFSCGGVSGCGRVHLRRKQDLYGSTKDTRSACGNLSARPARGGSTRHQEHAAGRARWKAAARLPARQSVCTHFL